MANITGKYNLANFGIYPYCKAEFHLSAADTDADAAYIPDAVSVVIGSDGSIDAELWENDNGTRGTVYTNNVVVYADSSYQREVKRICMGKIVVIGDAEIQDLLVTNVVPSTQEDALALAQAAAARAEAAAADLEELIDFADTFTLPTADGTNGQVLTTNGSGTLTFSTISGDTTVDVDAHLNTGTAASGEVLSWNGTDYDWIAVSGGAGAAALVGQTDSASPFETSLGSGAGAVNTGVNNTFVGYQAGKANTTGNNNVAVGYQSLDVNTTGAGNVGIGSAALGALTTGSNNVAIGNGALDAATTGGRNIAIGQDAMGLGVATAASGDNVAIGYQAGYDITSATSNVLLGYRAGWDVTTGAGNVAIGQETGDAITTGSANVAIGFGCLSAITTASSDIAIGYNAMVSATSTNPDNIAIGQDVMRAVSSGGNNTGVGSGSLRNLGVGSNNTAFGYDALKGTFGSASHSNNTGVGHSAGLLLTTGTNNTFVGYQAGDATTTGSNQIVIGNGSDASSATVSNEITLGNSSITTLRCQVTTITSLSDARDKTDIQPLNAGLEFVEALNPVSFTWNMRDGGKVGVADTGFIAQDLQAAQADTGVSIPGLVYDVNPDKLEAGYGKLIPVLVQAIKDLSAKVNLLEAQLEAQK